MVVDGRERMLVRTRAKPANGSQGDQFAVPRSGVGEGAATLPIGV